MLLGRRSSRRNETATSIPEDALGVTRPERPALFCAHGAQQTQSERKRFANSFESGCAAWPVRTLTDVESLTVRVM